MSHRGLYAPTRVKPASDEWAVPMPDNRRREAGAPDISDIVSKVRLEPAGRRFRVIRVSDGAVLDTVSAWDIHGMK